PSALSTTWKLNVPSSSKFSMSSLPSSKVSPSSTAPSSSLTTAIGKSSKWSYGSQNAHKNIPAYNIGTAITATTAISNLCSLKSCENSFKNPFTYKPY